MKLCDYYDNLAERYSAYFDVKREYSVLGCKLPIYAVFRVRSDKAFFTRKISLGGYENLEHCLVQGLTREIGMSDLENFTKLLRDSVKELVNPHPEHMSTTVTGVLVGERGVVPEAIGRAEKFHYGRSYRWGLHGWSQVRLIIVDLAAGKAYANKKGREVVKSYGVNSFARDLHSGTGSK